MKNLALIPLALVAASCASFEPAVSQYNGDSVTIQVNGSAIYLPEADKKALKIKMQAMATEICRRGHRKQADYASVISRRTGQYTSVIERLYLCLK